MFEKIIPMKFNVGETWITREGKERVVMHIVSGHNRPIVAMCDRKILHTYTREGLDVEGFTRPTDLVRKKHV